MKAIRIREGKGLDKMNVEEIDDAGEPGPGEVRVKLKATSLNYHDYAICTGGIPSDDGRIPMADGAGTVEAVGDGVQGLAVGDEVVSYFFPNWQGGDFETMGFGGVPGDGIDGYAREAVVRPAGWFSKAPEGWSHEESATLTTAGLTAWRILVTEGGLKPGDTVLTMGTGGVSMFALQFALAAGARVIATSSSGEKLDRLRELGAHEVVNYKEDENWGSTVRKLTGGRGVDIIPEIGGPGTLPQSLKAVAVNGTIGLVGVLTGAKGEVPTALLMQKQVTLKGVTVGSQSEQRDMIRACERSGIRPIIDEERFTLETLRQAFEREEAGKHFGKIVATI